MALQSENAHIIAQNAQKQCIIVKLPERITTLPKVTPQQRIGLCLAQVLGQCLPRKQAVPVTYVRHLSPMPAFRPFDEFHGLVKQRIRHFPLSLGKSGETTNAINTPAVSLSHALLIVRNVVFRIIHIETVGQLPHIPPVVLKIEVDGLRVIRTLRSVIQPESPFIQQVAVIGL